VSLGSYYDYSFEKESEITLRRRLNLLIARQLMPASGFAWIAGNPEALAVWLALLNEDYQGAGTLGAILIRADALALRRYFNQFLGGGHGVRTPRNRVGTFAGGVPESIQEIETAMGAHFLQWLTAAIESGVLMINKAPLLSVPGGMLMCPDIFKLFIRETPEFKNMLAAQKAFMSLGVHQVGAEGETDFRFEKSSNHEADHGMIFSAYAMVLPDEVTVYQNDSNKAMTMSAVECIHQLQASPALVGAQTPLLHLSKTGQWIAHAAGPLAPSLGMHRRG
jgi:hypothetical protein